jgi:hypothetical protein
LCFQSRDSFFLQLLDGIRRWLDLA